MQGQRLLVVEDNPGDTRLCQELLRDSRLAIGEVVCVPRLADALVHLSADRFGVVLLDLNLPDAQGLAGLRAILKEAPETPVVVLTGNTDEATAVQAVKIGAQDYLVKGAIEPEDLRRSVRYAMERQLHSEAESALHATEAKLHAIIANAPVILFAIDREGRLTLLEGKAAESLQAGLGRGVGSYVWDLVGIDAAEFRPVYQEVLAGRVGSGTMHVRDRVLEVHYDLQRDAGGTVVGVTGVGTDVTDRARAEDRFAKAFAGSPVAMAIIRLQDGRFLDANEAYARTVGYPRRELLGHTSIELNLWLNPEDRDMHLQRIRQERDRDEFPLTFRRKDGSLRSMMVSAARVDIGEMSCMLTTIRDVTDWKELQRKLVESERLASTGQFAGFIAHQINTPLTNISLLTHSIEKRVTDPVVREKLGKIDVQRRAAANILTDLMSFARHRELHPGEVDLRSTVLDACAQVEPFRHPSVALLQELPQESIVVRLDAPKVQEALVNLLKNAFEATVEGRVVIAVRARPDTVSVSVSDTGTGIPPEAMQHLFEPFFTTKPGSIGTGLGLTLCKTIAEAHGGRIEVSTEVGKGSTFTIVLPREITPS